MPFGQVAFAIGMIASGLLHLFKGDIVSPWEPLPPWMPGRIWLAYASGVLLVVGGIGLLLKRTSARSARVLLGFLALWWVVVKFPVLLAAPQIELRWLDWGQIAVLVAGAWSLTTTSDSQLRFVRYLFGVALIPIGLSHYFYLNISIPMVPAILPYRPGWVIFTGTAHIAAGLGVLFGVKARLAAILEASMITAFAVFVWLVPPAWVELVVTLAVGNAAWAVAGKIK